MKNIHAFAINPLVLVAAGMLSLPAVAVFAQQNLIVNGSFEAGPAGSATFTDWFIGPADNNSNFGVANSNAPPDRAEQGTYYAYFHGHPTDGSQDCLGQSVNLTVGAQYTITYYLGTDGSTLGSGAAMWVVIGPSFGIDYTQDVLLTAYYPNSASALPYQKFTTTITATNANPILSFHAVDANSAILLDNVSITYVAPPPPQLNFGLASTDKVVMSWTSPTNAFLLQTNTSLLTTNWVTLTNQPAVLGVTNQITLPRPATNVFYRLLLP